MLATRKATAEDAPLLVAMIRELAEFEHELEQVDITSEDLLRDGFRSSPYFQALIAEWDGRCGGCRVPLAGSYPEKIQMPGCDTRSSWAGLGSGWLAQRCRNWLRVRRQRARPAGLRRFRDRRSEWWHRPNPRTSFHRRGVPGA